MGANIYGGPCIRLKFTRITYVLSYNRNSTKVERLDMYTDNLEWKIISDITAEKRVTYYQCCEEPYPDITFTFHLQRDSPAHR